jgi:hypothetical protein
MKWLVYGCGLLISSAALVALSMSGVFPALGGIGSGLLTVCVYFLGVYLAPRLIIHRLQQRVSKEKPEDIVTIEPNRKPVRRDVVGYQLATFILVCASVLFALRCGSASSEVEQLQAQLEEQYHDRYEEGYADAESTAYESGYDVGCKDGYSTGYADGDAAGRSAILSTYYNELRFFRNGACIVTEEGYRYHHYGCHHIAGREYWIYNTELAEYKGYSPCIDCWEDGLLTITLS